MTHVSWEIFTCNVIRLLPISWAPFAPWRILFGVEIIWYVWPSSWNVPFDVEKTCRICCWLTSWPWLVCTTRTCWIWPCWCWETAGWRFCRGVWYNGRLMWVSWCPKYILSEQVICRKFPSGKKSWKKTYHYRFCGLLDYYWLYEIDHHHHAGAPSRA